MQTKWKNQITTTCYSISTKNSRNYKDNALLVIVAGLVGLFVHFLCVDFFLLDAFCVLIKLCIIGFGFFRKKKFIMNFLSYFSVFLPSAFLVHEISFCPFKGFCGYCTYTLTNILFSLNYGEFSSYFIFNFISTWFFLV